MRLEIHKCEQCGEITENIDDMEYWIQLIGLQEIWIKEKYLKQDGSAGLSRRARMDYDDNEWRYLDFCSQKCLEHWLHNKLNEKT